MSSNSGPDQADVPVSSRISNTDIKRPKVETQRPKVETQRPKVETQRPKGDTFFSEPYTPSESVSETLVPAVDNKETRLDKGANKKPIAALFMPPSSEATGE